MIDLAPRFEQIARRKAELEAQLSDPATARDPRRLAELSRAHRDVSELLEAFREYEASQQALREARELTGDADPALAELARQELQHAQERHERAQARLRALLLPRDPADERNTILEIRAGTGGQEAALFAADLLRMYTRYAERRGWRVEMLSSSESELGGFKEVVLSIVGAGAYSRLKFEGGTHRVQRVPVTESQGRIHTSAVTVAVMPEAEEVDVAIRPEDLKIDVFRSGGPGGQSVNTTDSAVRITHLPTGLVVICQDEKSQHKNKAKALKVLRSRLFERVRAEQESAIARQRRAQVGSGDRSERIRTYNFPQNRVTDHRINLTLHALDRVLDGELDPIVEALAAHSQTEMLKDAG